MVSVSPPPLTVIVYVPGFVFAPTFHVQLTLPFASDVLSSNPFALLSPEL
jgi:hypothetical protein